MAEAIGASGPGAGVLWIVATPIGTLDDLSPRAVEVLTRVRTILSEDTRRTRALLGHFEIAAGGRLRSLHEHNEKALVSGIARKLEEGYDVALVSDAGTPVLSDPGFLLVREARRRQLEILSVPGPSSFTAALAASGQPPLPATLIGFLPPRAGARRRRLAELARVNWTMVVLLSPHRLGKELEDLAAVLGEDRPATLLVELSKQYERAEFGTLGAISRGREVAMPRGEYVLVVGPEIDRPESQPPPYEEVRACFDAAVVAGCDRKQALRQTASVFGLRRREVYQIIFVEEKEPENENQ